MTPTEKEVSGLLGRLVATQDARDADGFLAARDSLGRCLRPGVVTLPAWGRGRRQHAVTLDTRQWPPQVDIRPISTVGEVLAAIDRVDNAAAMLAEPVAVACGEPAPWEA